MKKLFLLFAFTLYSMTLFCQTQIENAHIKCVYQLTFQPDSTNKNSVLQEEMLLIIGQTHSLFIASNKYYNDSVAKSHSHLFKIDPVLYLEQSGINQKPPSYSRSYIYKNHQKKEINYMLSMMDNYEYYEPFSQLKWILLPDKEEMLGHVCQKAKLFYGGREWEAWFDPEIPIKDGPYTFCGLPGLIVKIQDAKKHYVFELNSITKAPSYYSIYKQDLTTITLSKCDFFEAQRKYKEGIPAMALANTINPDPELIKEVEARQKRKNNPIELKCD